MKTQTVIVTFLCAGLWLVVSCSHLNYVGRTYPPTENVEIYFSQAEVTKEYLTIGHAISAGQLFVSIDKLQTRLMEEARKKGADAIIIKEIDRDSELDGPGFDAEKQIKATFIKYR